MTDRRALAACALLLVVFAALAMTAALRESATFDEPVQTVAGWIKLRQGDYRLNIEDPPLWEEWAALPNGPNALKPNFYSTEWAGLLEAPAKQWRFVTKTLWNTRGVDGAAFVNRSRGMMLIVGLLLGGFIAFFAWRLAGPFAGLSALTLYALDPNFLAHAALVKNDVPAAFAMLLTAWFTWRLGQRITLGAALGLALSFALALNIKFSCVLLVPMMIGMLGVRALLDEAWLVGRGRLKHRPARFLVAAGLLAFVALVAFAGIWAAYRFRFGATPNPAEHISTDWVTGHLERAQSAAAGDGAAWNPDLVTRALLWMLSQHLLPESWLNGFLFTYATAVFRRGFLFGQLSPTGFWYYFPAAMLMKTPVATITAVALGIGVGIRFIRDGARHFQVWWAATCLCLPPAIYLASSMRTHMNIGIRHVLPIYVFGFVGTGVLASLAIARWGLLARRISVGLACLLAVETGMRAPHFISFFNLFTGGPLSGLHLLGDSNLDWGQDLPLLAAWQKAHPDQRLYLSYFGMVDPAYYGVAYRPLPGNYAFGPMPNGEPLKPPAVVAVSASHLQGISIGARLGDRYTPLLHRPPMEVLGGTIYLFDVPDEATAGSLLSLTAP
jgi:hypothetical protein